MSYVDRGDRKMRFVAILVAIAIAIAIAYFAFLRVLPSAKITIGVKALDGYSKPTKSAMKIWNGFVGCEFFVPGDDVVIMSESGEPCGDPWRPEDEWHHSATAYRCGERTEIFISKPANINTQACIITHELGHRLKEFGVEHNPIGVMSNSCSSEEQNVLAIRDRDVAALKEALCR